MVHHVIPPAVFPRCADQRNLGMSMRVERSSLDQVKKRFEMNKRKREEQKKEYDMEERLHEIREEVGQTWIMWVDVVWINILAC